LVALIRTDHPSAIALVGGGGSGKSTLAAAIGHRLRPFFRGRVAWVRIGAWDKRTVLEMMALEWGHAPGDDPARTVRRAIGAEPALVVLDNHESDATTAAVLDALRGVPVTWLLTARRCLLGGVTVFPVVPPLVERREILFPRVAELTRLLRWNAVALDIADALVEAKLSTPRALAEALVRRGVGRIRPMAHEDDVPEVAGVVRAALTHLSPLERRLLGALAASRGDWIHRASLFAIARAGSSGEAALSRIRKLRLVQEPAPACFTLHATVRTAVERVVPFDPGRVALHYLQLFDAHPEAIAEEPTQLFALMDWAQDERRLDVIMRVTALADKLTESSPSPKPAPAADARTGGRGRKKLTPRG